MTFIVATNVVATRPPERRPTGTPHAQAKKSGIPTTSVKSIFADQILLQYNKNIKNNNCNNNKRTTKIE